MGRLVATDGRSYVILRAISVAMALCVAQLWLAAIAGAGSPNREQSAHSSMHQRMQVQLNAIPAETEDGECNSTKSVHGIGDACRSKEGLFKVQLDNGSYALTHGFDAPPPLAMAGYLSGSQNAVDTATPEDVACVSSSTSKHSLLIYAYPKDSASRYSEIAPLLRQEVYRLSAFLNAESQAVDPAKGKRLKVKCDASGEAEVVDLKLLHSSTADSFETIVSDMAELGYGGTPSLNGYDRYIVYYDSPIANGAAGTGHLYPDDTNSKKNFNNISSSVAVEFGWSSVPHWDVLLHEIGHNMGAVQFSAPHTTNKSYGAHCNDGGDIMCYDDGEANANYDPNACSTVMFDCNRDDFFHPTPSAGSYLASHWNIASTNNQFLEHVTDTTPPTMPSGLTVKGASDRAIGLTWSAASDAVGVAGYNLFWRLPGESAWTAVGSTNRLRGTVGQLQATTAYEVGVSAFDTVGNKSDVALLSASTTADLDLSAPGAPAAIRAVDVGSNSIEIEWDDVDDNVGASQFSVVQWDGSQWQVLEQTRSTTASISSLSPATSYQIGVWAVDDAGNQSPTTQASLTTSKDNVKPDQVKGVRIIGRSRKSLRIRWQAASDDVGIASYEVYLKKNGRWKKAGKVANHPLFKMQKLRSGVKYAVRVRAVDKAGNRGKFSKVVRAATRG